MQALIIVPSRELAIQTAHVIHNKLKLSSLLYCMLKKWHHICHSIIIIN